MRAHEAGALHAGDLDLAVLAVTPYGETADPTPGGVNWAVRPGPARSHHIAHGTLGIVSALAAVGTAAGSKDMLALALAGAADVVSRNATYLENLAQISWLTPFVDPSGDASGSVHALVIEVDDQCLIVDTCIGNDKDRDVPAWNHLQLPFLERFREAAISRKDRRENEAADGRASAGRRAVHA